MTMMDYWGPRLLFCSKQLENWTKLRKLFSDIGQQSEQDCLSCLSPGFDFVYGQGSSLNLLKDSPLIYNVTCVIPPLHCCTHPLLARFFVWYHTVLLLQFYNKLLYSVQLVPPICDYLKVPFGPLLFHKNFTICLLSSILFNKILQLSI